jgi:hypothetical protein
MQKVTVPAFTVELPGGTGATAAVSVTLCEPSEYCVDTLCAAVVVARVATVNVLVPLLTEKFPVPL